MERFVSIFKDIYDERVDLDEMLGKFKKDLIDIKASHFQTEDQPIKDWYKDAVIYSMYVDLFNHDMDGLEDKLDDLQDLGITCLWLLPILESPMKDAGFDISNYTKVRQDLLGGSSFEHIVDQAHKRGIKIIFDIAMNHCSVEHPWFVEARKDKKSPYRDFFIWSDTEERYKEARIIFKGLCSSNWEYDHEAGQYFYHRFFDIQPDLNYRNPEVLLTMTKTLVNWKVKGVDGFRADAIPYIWKEEGSNCENLPKTHLVVKFMRAVLDFLSQGTLLLAEACQQPDQVVEYFGKGDECQAAYHFPVMPRIYLSMAKEDASPIIETMDKSFTPKIPDSCQWFMFLRCHDELTLEMVTPEERRMIYDHYVSNPLWDFRQGEGISSRLSELLGFDQGKVGLAYSIMFTLLGTPIIYYGDEYGKANDYQFYEEYSAMTGYKDTRYLVRGPMNWPVINEDMKDPTSRAYQTYHMIKEMVTIRKSHRAFSRGSLRFVKVYNKGREERKVLAYLREYGQDKVLVLQNLSKDLLNIQVDNFAKAYDLFTEETYELTNIDLAPYQVMWLDLSK